MGNLRTCILKPDSCGQAVETKMKTFLLVCCLVVSAVSAENIVELAERLGAKTLVSLVKEAGLANTLATGGKRCLCSVLL